MSSAMPIAAFGCRKSGPGHPFRASLPRHVLTPLPVPEPEVLAAMARAGLRSEPVNWKRITLQDAKDFLLAYCACFVALMAFIS
jgi:hypothetical protein